MLRLEPDEDNPDQYLWRACKGRINSVLSAVKPCEGAKRDVGRHRRESNQHTGLPTPADPPALVEQETVRAKRDLDFVSRQMLTHCRMSSRCAANADSFKIASVGGAAGARPQAFRVRHGAPRR